MSDRLPAGTSPDGPWHPIKDHPVPLADLRLASLPLLSVPDLPGMLAGLADTLGSDIPDLDVRLESLLTGLDRALERSPFNGDVSYIDDATSVPDLLDRYALLRWCADTGLPVQRRSDSLWEDRLSPLPKRRALTPVELLFVRLTTASASDEVASTEGCLEAGATSLELANLPPAAVLRPSASMLDLPGSSRVHSRTCPTPPHISDALRRLRDEKAGGPWLLHESRAGHADGRQSALLMTFTKTLKTAPLAAIDKVTAQSVRRTGLRRLVDTNGAAGLNEAQAAAGHINAETTFKLITCPVVWP